MRILKNTDRDKLLHYVASDEAYNLFIIGDVENFGLEGEHVEVAVNEGEHGWDSAVLRYDRFFVPYARQKEYDTEAVADYIKAHTYQGVNGKGSVVERLIPYFPDLRPRTTTLARVDAINDCGSGPCCADVREVLPRESEAIVSLYCQIPEFRGQYVGREAEQEKSVARNLTLGGTGVGAFVDGRLVSYAQLSAKTSRSAMVTGVCTLPSFEHRGLATHVLLKLCRTAFEGGLSFLCLFYDNPSAGRIYERIGFLRVGGYMMLTPAEKR